jgi:hypothetical protein
VLVAQRASGERRGRAVVAGLKAEARCFAEAAAAELGAGMALHLDGTLDLTDAVAAGLDGHPDGDAVAVAAARAGLRVHCPHGIVLLVDPADDTANLAAAAAAITDRVADTLDLGDGGPRLHRRVLVAHLSPGQWLDTRTQVHDIAADHGLLAIAPAAAPILTDLVAVYRTTVGQLDGLTGAGVRTGIVDPQCIAATRGLAADATAA